MGIEIDPGIRLNIQAEMVRRELQMAGLNVPDVDAVEFMDGIRRRYLEPTLETVIGEEIPQIKQYAPDFAKNHPLINSSVTTDSLRALYAGKKDLIGRYGSLEKITQGASYSLKVWLRHIRFFMLDHPDKQELDHAIESAEEILEGNWGR